MACLIRCMTSSDFSTFVMSERSTMLLGLNDAEEMLLRRVLSPRMLSLRVRSSSSDVMEIFEADARLGLCPPADAADDAIAPAETAAAPRRATADGAAPPTDSEMPDASPAAGSAASGDGVAAGARRYRLGWSPQCGCVLY